MRSLHLRAQLLHPAPCATRQVDPDAQCRIGAVIDATAVVAPGAVVGVGARVGSGAVSAPGASSARARLGATIAPLPARRRATGCDIGERVHRPLRRGDRRRRLRPRADDGRWIKIPQIGRVVIGDDVEIGANTTIDRGAMDDTVIEDGVKLDNQIQIGHNCRIGAHTAMAGCVGHRRQHRGSGATA